MIFAVTEEQFDVYNLLQANIEGSSAGKTSIYGLQSIRSKIILLSTLDQCN